MSAVGTVFLVLLSVGLGVPIIYYVFKWVFRQLVARPFLQGEQPPLTVEKPFSWPPQWPFTSPPERSRDPDLYAKWKHRWIVFGVYWVIALLCMTPFGLGNIVNTNTDGSPNFFIALGYHILGSYIICPFALGIVDFFTALGFLYARYTKAVPMPNQRKHWELERWSASVLLLAIFTIVGLNTGYQWGRESTKVTHVHVPLKRLPACMDGVTIFHITDVHTGPNVSEDFVKATAKVARDQNPDIVVHTGDGGDGNPSLIGKFNKGLGDLNTNNRFFVTGNHEYTHGANGTDWEKFWANENGFTVLHNEAARLGATELPNRGCGGNDVLNIVGIPDVSRSDPDLQLAASSVIAGEEWILLSHQPSIFNTAATEQITDKHVGLQLSGHVHAGQVFPLHPLIYLASGGLFSGLIQTDESFVYVSNGNANWGTRVRFLSSPQNTMIHLRNADIFAAEGEEVDTSFTSETKAALWGLVLMPLWLAAQLWVYYCERNGTAWWRDDATSAVSSLIELTNKDVETAGSTSGTGDDEVVFKTDTPEKNAGSSSTVTPLATEEPNEMKL